MLSIEMITRMLELQTQLEERISGPEWRSAQHDYLLAVYMESAELVDYTPWKWWKDTNTEEVDWTAIRLELVDIWHFGLAHVLQRNPDRTILELAEYLYQGIEQAVAQDREGVPKDVVTLVVNLGIIGLETQVFPVELFVLLCESCGFAAEDLYINYIAKQVLNNFRQDHGYADGTYRKQWKYHGQEMQDNEVLVRIMEQLIMVGGAEAVQYELVYDALVKVYSEHVAH